MLEQNEEKGKPVIKARGRLEGKNVYEMHKKVKAIEDSGYEGLIILDIESVTTMDSRSLGALINMWKMLDTDKNDLVLYRPQGIVRDLLYDTNLHRVLKIVDNV